MTALSAAALYAGLNILILFVLAVMVSLNRRRAKVSLGIGTDDGLEKAVRAHGNAVEWAAPGLAGLILLALLDTTPLYMHILGVALTLGRGLHAYGIITSDGPNIGRMVGTLLNWLSFLGMGLLLVGAAIS